MSGHRVRAGSNVLISMLGALAILIAVNYLSMRHYIRSDWTSAGIYTLSDKSAKMLYGMDREVKLYLLWSQADMRYPDVKELLDRYVAASSHIKMEVLDQDLNPDRVQIIIEKYGAKMRNMGQGMVAIEASIIVVSGDNVKFVSSADFEDFNGDMLGGNQNNSDKLSGYKAEQAVSSAILAVTSDEQQKVCFTQGHGEWLFEGFGGRALGHLKDELIQDGYKVQAITTTGASRIPPGCNLVAVVSPQNALMEQESTILERYLTRGGRLLLLLDPIIEEMRFVPTGLESLTAKQGIRLSRDILFEVDSRRLVSASPFTFTATQFAPHAAVKQLAIPESVGTEAKRELGAYPVVFSMARSLAQISETEAIADILATSSDVSWGEVDITSLESAESVPAKDQYDTPGPAILAMAASLAEDGNTSEPGRLVVVGDSDFLANELFLNASLNNRDFWSGLVGWLTAREELISIAPKNPEHIRLNLTEDDMSTVWQLLIGEVLFFILLGIIVWIRRRS
jgi:ABC-type uncharacterized transport system involved in gliding motility auxiliary subunit